MACSLATTYCRELRRDFSMITKDDIERFLQEINDEMEKRDVTGEIVICGGAVMTMVYEARPSTKDLDGLFAPIGPINEIARNIATREGLEDDWLNDAAKGFIDTSRMELVTIREYGNLTVRMPDAEAMLAMKLTSARLVGKDRDDALFFIEHLNVESEEQLFDIIERNIAPQRLTPMAHFFTIELFQQYLQKKETDLTAE